MPYVRTIERNFSRSNITTYEPNVLWNRYYEAYGKEYAMLPLTVGTEVRLREFGRMWYEVYGFHLTNGQIVDFCLHNINVGEVKFHLPQNVSLKFRSAIKITKEQHKKLKKLWAEHKLNRDLVFWLIIHQGLLSIQAIYLQHKQKEVEHAIH